MKKRSNKNFFLFACVKCVNIFDDVRVERYIYHIRICEWACTKANQKLKLLNSCIYGEMSVWKGE